MRQPRTVTVDLVADEHTWKIAPGRVVSGYAFKPGQVPVGQPLLRWPVTLWRSALPIGYQNRPRSTGTACGFPPRWTAPRPCSGRSRRGGPSPTASRSLTQARSGITRTPTRPSSSRRASTAHSSSGSRRSPSTASRSWSSTTSSSIATGQIARFGGRRERHDGREGDIRLVNGQIEPALTIPAGQVERWRVISTPRARYVLLSIGGRPFRMLGTDGGLIEAPVDGDRTAARRRIRAELAVGPFAERETSSTSRRSATRAAW